MDEADRSGRLEPGPHEVAPGVHRLPCPLPHDGLRAVNVYVLEGADGLTLIDTGWRQDETARALDDGLAALGGSRDDVVRVLCTHAHYDHYGLAGDLQRHGAQVVLGREEVVQVDVARDRASYEAYMTQRRELLLRLGADEVVRGIDERPGDEYDALRSAASWSPPDRLLDDGETITIAGRTLRAIVTGGHTQGHIVLLDSERRLLFAGDHVLPYITPSLGFEAEDDGRALDRFLTSLDRVRDLEVDLVLPGHGRVFADLAGRVDELHEHHRVRLAATLATLAGGPATAYEVAAQLRWTRHGRTFAELSLFNRMLATTETGTHLVLLADRGAVVADDATSGPTCWHVSDRGTPAVASP